MAIKTVRLNSVVANVGALFLAVFLLISLIFVIRWYLASAATANVRQKEVAEVLVSLAPSDPNTHYALAYLLENSFNTEDINRSLQEYEKAVALSPHDYRFWLALGFAKEKYESSESAEFSFRKALELAPNYAQVHWLLGNNLLRQGREDEALSEIRIAVEKDESLAVPAVATLWLVLRGDLNKILNRIGDSEAVKSALSVVLARDKRFDEAFRLWQSLSEESVKKYKNLAEQLFNLFLSEKKFRYALHLKNQISDGKFEVEKFRNPSFEDEINVSNSDYFNWTISEGTEPRIGINKEQKRSGEQSLFLIFNSPTEKNLRYIQQMIVVSPNQTYKLKLFFRSNLKAQRTLVWQVVDAVDGKILAETEPIESEADWMPLETTFITPPTTEAIIVRLKRASCFEQICPISGKVWFDDFSLEK
jgi:tetratricopeptide (TPR) repeat protein